MFRSEVLARVQKLLTSRAMTFLEVLRNSLNCDPAVIHGVLEEGVCEGLFRVDARDNRFVFMLRQPHDSVDNLQSEHPAATTALSHGTRNEDMCSAVEAVVKALPDPTPVYSQWWFSRGTYSRLLQLLNYVKTAHCEVAFLGAPSLAALYSQRSATPITVFDVDTEVLRSLGNQFSSRVTLVPYDVANSMDKTFVGRFGIVFSDPPWGRTLLPLFLWRSYELVREGGAVVISLPQVLTRPGVRDEIRDLLRHAGQWGMTIEQFLAGGTEYRVPPFEREAYRNLGIDLDLPWRRGDVLVLRKIEKAAIVEPLEPSTRNTWSQWRIGKQRLFLSRLANGNGQIPSIQPVPGAKSFTCTSTSSRSNMFHQASLVTTQNGFAVTSGTAVLMQLLPQCLEDLGQCHAMPSLKRNGSDRDLLVQLGSALKRVCTPRSYEAQ